MKILFVGDVVGRPGRRALEHNLSGIIKDYNIDFTIVNGENSAHGKGITTKIFNGILSYGADVITMGNHTYAKADIYEIIADEKLVVPMNMEMPKDAKGYREFKFNDKKIIVANVCTEAFMHNVTIKTIDAFNELKSLDADIKIVDLHGEATAEKITYMHLFKNDFTAILGTHTHIQTADEDIFNGCAYISDVGMCGSYESIIGRDIEEVVNRMIHDEVTHYTVSKNPAVFCAVVIEVDDISNQAVSIERIQIRP